MVMQIQMAKHTLEIPLQYWSVMEQMVKPGHMSLHMDWVQAIIQRIPTTMEIMMHGILMEMVTQAPIKTKRIWFGHSKTVKLELNLLPINVKKCPKLLKNTGQGVLNAAQTKAAADNDSYIEKIFDYFLDKLDKGLGKLGNLLSGSVISYEPFNNLTISWDLDSVIPANANLDLYFSIGMDSDNNIANRFKLCKFNWYR